MTSRFDLEEASVHYFDQTHTETLIKLRKERRGFYVMMDPDDPVYGIAFVGTADELVSFLETVIKNASIELEHAQRAIAEADAA